MKRDQIIYPLCMDLTKPKATYITHDGYVRPCCYTHRHQKIEADERWMNDPKHNVKSGKSLQEMFDTTEYQILSPFGKSPLDCFPKVFLRLTPFRRGAPKWIRFRPHVMPNISVFPKDFDRFCHVG